MKILRKRATIDILAIAGLATFVMLAGDAWITAKVKAALLADTQVRGLALDVDAKDGVVILRGTAATQAEIDAARKIALGIEGVRAVAIDGQR